MYMMPPIPLEPPIFNSTHEKANVVINNLKLDVVSESVITQIIQMVQHLHILPSGRLVQQPWSHVTAIGEHHLGEVYTLSYNSVLIVTVSWVLLYFSRPTFSPVDQNSSSSTRGSCGGGMFVTDGTSEEPSSYPLIYLNHIGLSRDCGGLCNSCVVSHSRNRSNGAEIDYID